MILNLVLLFILGTILGSFLNVLIYRLQNIDSSLIFGRSFCPHCQKKLLWYDLIPLLSFIALQGRCRFCHKPISWQYPAVELFSALLLLGLFVKFGISVSLLLYYSIALLLLAILVYDFLHQLIPDILVYPAILLALFVGILDSGSKIFNFQFSIFNSLYGLLIGAGFLALIVWLGRGKWMGVGDIKLGAVLGLGLGFPNVIAALFLAFILGSLYGILLIILKKKTLKDTIAFGPFLVVGFYLALFWGEFLVNWYLKTVFF